MSNIERILVVVDAEEDFTETSDGLPVELSKALRFIHNKSAAELLLLCVGYEKYLHHSFYSIGYDHLLMRKEYVDRLEEILNGLAEKLQDQGFRASAEVVWAHPRYEQIVKKADEFKADLVVQHVRAHAKFEFNHLTNDSWQLVRHCKHPLLLVKDKEWSDPVVMMAAVDPMHSHNKPLRLDYRILDTAVDVSAQTGGDLHVVHAYGESARPFAAAGKIKEEHSLAFDALLTEYNFAATKVHFIDETPLYALQHFSEKIDCNVIVMGAISRSRFSEAMIGSTAEQALDYIKTDVLIVKPQV